MFNHLAILFLGAVLSIPLCGQELRPEFYATSISAADLELEIAWKERGVWPEAVIHNAVTAEGEATYICLEGGRKRLADRQNVEGALSSEGDFSANADGKAVGRLRLKPPGPGQFSCPPGQKLKLACVAYKQLGCRDDTFVISKQFRRTLVLFQPGYSEFCYLDLE